MADDSTTTIRTTFETHEATDLDVEHLLQQHGIWGPDIFVQSASDRNTAGAVPSGGDAFHEEALAATRRSPARSRSRRTRMPLTWTQVKSDLDPRRFTVRTVPALLAKTSARQDYCDGERPLEPAIKRLGNSRRAA